MIRFEKAKPKDAEILTEVQTRTFDDDSQRFAGKPSGGPPGYDSVEWQIRMMKRGMYYKILAEDRIIGGFIIFDMRKRHYNLGRIYIDPDFQNQGIGTQAMEFMERAFPLVKKWSLGTPRWAYRNHHFYEKMGYIKVGEDPRGDFLYEKRIIHIHPSSRK